MNAPVLPVVFTAWIACYGGVWQEDLLPRAARLKDASGAYNNNSNMDADDEDDDDDGAGRKGAGRGGRGGPKGARVPKATSGGSNEPGPPVDGAALRVDEW